MDISVTRGLAELKLLDSRINSTIHSGKFAVMTTGKKVVTGYTSNDEFVKKQESHLQSILDLMERRKAIKSAIVASNAVTMVTIGGKEMSVAEAIERKSSIVYEQTLLSKLRTEYNQAVARVERENEQVQIRLDELIKSTFGKDTKVSTEQYESTSKPFLEQNQAKLVSVNNLREKIEKMEKEIAEFLNEVDFTLSESNTITKIVIPD